MALLEVDDIVAGYGGGPDILTGLSLQVERERSYCIIGPNGAGKSTLLRVICGLLPPRRGQVTFKGESLGVALVDRMQTADTTALTGLPLIWLAGVLRDCGLSVP